MAADPSILEPVVRRALEEAGATFEVMACDPSLADTSQFCAAYGIPADRTANTIVVVMKKMPRAYVAGLVLADTRLDVNHRVAAAVGFKRLSFASSDETAALTGMTIGGVTAPGLPPTLPILIDDAVFEKDWVIVGGGNRSSKVRIAPAELLKLPGARRASIAIRG